MKSLKSYLNGFKAAINTKKLVTLLYSTTLLLTLVIAIPFGKTIENKAGYSGAIHNLLYNYDYTIYSDFMNQYSDAIQPFISTAVWIAVLYLIFTVFFTGGILKILKMNEASYFLSSFWKACAQYFSRFFRLAVYMIILHVILAIIVFLLLSMILDSAYNTVQSEASLFYIALAGVIIYLIFFIYLLAVTDYAKIMMFKYPEYRPLRTVVRAFAFVTKHLFSTFGLYKLLLVFPIILFIVYFIISSAIGMSNGFLILLTFIIQQIVIWFRVFTKVWFLGSEMDLFDTFDNKQQEEIIAEAVPAN